MRALSMDGPSGAVRGTSTDGAHAWPTRRRRDGHAYVRSLAQEQFLQLLRTGAVPPGPSPLTDSSRVEYHEPGSQ